MNRQLIYIAHAQMLLAGLLIGFSLLSRIPVTSTHDTEEWGCAVVSETPTVPLSPAAMKGKALFMSKCASCHHPKKDMTGPALGEALQNEQWRDRQKLYAWIRSPEEFMKTDAYTRRLKKTYKSMMTPFPTIINEEIDAIVAYVTEAY